MTSRENALFAVLPKQTETIECNDMDESSVEKQTNFSSSIISSVAEEPSISAPMDDEFCEGEETIYKNQSVMKCLNLSRRLQALLLKGREKRLNTNHQIMQWAKNPGSRTMLLNRSRRKFLSLETEKTMTTKA